MRGSPRSNHLYQLKKLKLSADFFFSAAGASSDSPGEMIARLNRPNCADISEPFVERERHAGVERGGDRPVIVRERVMHWIPERRFDLGGGDAGCPGPIEQDADALAADAQLTHAFDQPLRIAHGRHIGGDYDEERVGGVERADRARVDGVARVDEHVIVRAAQHPEQFLDRARVRGRWPVGLLRSGEDFQLGLVLRDQLPEKIPVQPMQVVDGVEHREPWAHAEKERHLAEARLEVENQRRSLRQPAELHRRVHPDSRGAGPSFGAKEHECL